MTYAHTHLRTLALVACLVLAAAVAPAGGLLAPAGSGVDDGAAAPGDDSHTAVDRGAAGERVATATPDGRDGSDTNWTVDADAAGGMGTESTSGEAFASAIAAHDTELEGEVRHRAFDRRLAVAENETASLRLLGETLRTVRLRLALLESRRDSLRESFRNGTISRGTYRVELARVTTEARSLRQVLDRVDRAAAERLPRTVGATGTTRAEYGLENETFDALRSRADAVGNRSGTPLEDVGLDADSTLDAADVDFDRPAWNETLTDGGDTLNGSEWYTWNGSNTTGDTTTADNGTEDRYPERRMSLLTLDGNVTELQGTHDHLADRSDGDREVEEALACARDALDDARVAIDDARAALDADDPARADDRIADARAAVTRARDCLEQARAALADDDGADDSSGSSTPTEWRTSK